MLKIDNLLDCTYAYSEMARKKARLRSKKRTQVSNLLSVLLITAFVGIVIVVAANAGALPVNVSGTLKGITGTVTGTVGGVTTPKVQLDWTQYLSVSTTSVNVTLHRNQPNYDLMKTDKASYSEGLVYGSGLTLVNKLSGGFRLSYDQNTTGVGLYENASGLKGTQSLAIHTYANPTKPNGDYKGKVTVQFYDTTNQVWANGPTIDYDIKLQD